VKGYRSVEQDSIVWIWMGAPQLANPRHRAHSWHEDRMELDQGPLPSSTELLLINDNLMT